MSKISRYPNCSELESIPACIERAASSNGQVTFVTGDVPVQQSWAEFHQQAKQFAATLQQRGVSSDSHVAILGPTSQELVTAIQGIWLAGATLVVLPMPMRLASLEDFIAATYKRIADADCNALVIDESLLAFLDASHEQLAGVSCLALQELYVDDSVGIESFVRPQYKKDDLLALQFTSGSTSSPKGVMLPNHLVTANLDAIAEAAEMERDKDVIVSWLPLYHDMGLIGVCTFAMAQGTDLVLGAPQDFLASPLRWMEWISTYGGTATAGPNFSYALAARALRRSEKTLDLSSLRIALNGAETVDPHTVRAFVEAAAPHGFRPEAVFPAFGMAEVGIAASFPKPLSGMKVDRIKTRTFEEDNTAVSATADDEEVTEIVLLGSAVPGLALRIVDPSSGEVLPERAVGELQISGTSVTPGYYKKSQESEELFDDKWLKTGDLAYMVDGELALCGRLKDLIIVGGRNVYPQDIEREVGALENIRTGNVVAYGLSGKSGKEKIVVVAETKKSDDHEELKKEVKEAVVHSVALPCHQVILVKPRTLPKTSSGKLQRAKCQKLVAADLLELW